MGLTQAVLEAFSPQRSKYYYNLSFFLVDIVCSLMGLIYQSVNHVFFFPLTVLMKTRVRNSFLLLGYVSIYNDVFIVLIFLLLYLAQSVFVFNLSAGGESGDC